MKKFRKLITGTVIAMMYMSLSAQIYHVEPPNWWAGMKNQNLQLLVNGKNVGETTPIISYPGIVIQKINQGDSKNYVFLDLYIAASTKPGPFSIFFVKDGDTLYNYKYTLLAREKDIPVKGFNSSDVIYLLNPDRFANGEPASQVSGLVTTDINFSCLINSGVYPSLYVRQLHAQPV